MFAAIMNVSWREARRLSKRSLAPPKKPFAGSIFTALAGEAALKGRCVGERHARLLEKIISERPGELWFAGGSNESSRMK
jgi:hypothetical protein